MKTKRHTERERKQKLSLANEDHKSSAHRIDKKQVNVKAAAGAEATGELGGSFTPSEEELTKINQFTRKEVGADDVVAFKTMSCNDLYDRDDERFTPDTIDEFVAMEPPASFTGKSFMADHDYQMGKVRGRIFDTDGETVEGIKFVTNKIYVPKTQQYADYIENLDFGLAWAVSVGVVIDKANCSIPGCGAEVYTSRFMGMSWCREGHDKGLYYVPGEEESDDYGYFIDVDPDTPGAVKAQVDLSDPIDCYELSQVFLGAQYFAELADKSPVQRMFKAASARPVPILSVGRKAANDLPLPTEPTEVAEAREKGFDVKSNSDGDPSWVDDSGLRWVYQFSGDDTNGEALCLGKEGDHDGEGIEDGSGGASPGPVVRADGPEVDGGGDVDDGEGQRPGEGDEGGEPAPVERLGGGEGQPPELTDDAPANDDKSGGSPDGKEVELSKSALLALARKCKLPTEFISAMEEAEGDELDSAVTALGASINKLQGQVTELTPKAALGDEYLKSLRTDVIRFYTLSKQSTPGEAISVASLEKILDRVGDDPEILKGMIEDYRTEAQRKFPSVRRSAEPSDPHDVEDSSDGHPAVTARGRQVVSSIHGR